MGAIVFVFREFVLPVICLIIIIAVIWYGTGE